MFLWYSLLYPSLPFFFTFDILILIFVHPYILFYFIFLFLPSNPFSLLNFCDYTDYSLLINDLTANIHMEVNTCVVFFFLDPSLLIQDDFFLVCKFHVFVFMTAEKYSYCVIYCVNMPQFLLFFVFWDRVSLCSLAVLELTL